MGACPAGDAGVMLSSYPVLNFALLPWAYNSDVLLTATLTMIK